MKQTNERLCALAQKGDAAALDSLIDNNKSFISKVANDLFRSMNLAQAGLNLDTDDLKQAGNLGLWKAVPKFDAARGMKFLTYAAPAIRNAIYHATGVAINQAPITPHVLFAKFTEAGLIQD